MQACELLDLPKTKYINGFKVGKKGRVIWTDVYADGDRKRIRLTRIEPMGKYSHPQVFIRYVKPSTEVEVQ